MLLTYLHALQVQHETLLRVRKEGNAHDKYNSFRSAFEILETDEDLAETIAFGPIYVHHLATLEAQRAEIAATLPKAA